MNESRTIHVSTIVVACLWATSFVGVGIGWMLVISGHPRAAMMVGFTDMVVVALAVVATLRLYTIRISSMIRALHGIDQGGSGFDLGNIERLRKS